MKRLARQLSLYRRDHFRMAMSYVENTEAAKAIDVFVPLNVSVSIRACVAPLHDGPGAVYFRGFSVFKKTGIYVIAKIFNCFACDPRRLFGRDRLCLN